MVVMNNFPGTPTSEEKTYGVLSWVLGFLVSFLGPLIFFLISTDKPFAKRHAAMALGTQLVLAVIGIVLVITVVGIVLLPVVGVASIVFAIMGAIAANNGNEYTPPVIGSFIANLFKV